MTRFKLSRRAGRRDPRDQAAPPRAARGDEDPRRAGRARRASATNSRRRLKSKAKLKQAGARRDRRRREEVRRRAPPPAGRARGGAGDRRDRAGRQRAGHGRAVEERLGARGARATRSIRARSPTRPATSSRPPCRGRSTQQAVFLDTTGRAYSLPAHTLPSARGQGEPLSGRLDPPDGATFAGVLIGEPDERWVHRERRRLRLRRAARRAAQPQPRGQGGAQGAGGSQRCSRRRRDRPPTDALLAAVNSDGRLLVVPGRGPAGAAARQGQQDLRHFVEEGGGRRGVTGGDRGRCAGPDVAAAGRRAAHEPLVQGARRLPRRARSARRGAAARLAQGRDVETGERPPLRGRSQRVRLEHGPFRARLPRAG